MSANDELIAGSHFEKVARHGGLYLLSSALVAGGNALLLPVYAYYLSPAEFGVFTNLVAVGAITGVIASLQVDFTYSRLIFDANTSEHEVRRLLSTLYLFVVVWGTASSLLASIWLDDYVGEMLGVPYLPHVLLACLIPVLVRCNALAAAHFRARQRSWVVAASSLARFVVVAVVGVGLLWSGMHTAEALLWGLCAGSGAHFVLLSTMLVREGLLGLSFSWRWLKESMVFSLALLPTVISGWVIGEFDKLLISDMDSVSASGVYSIAFEVGRVLSLFVDSVFMAYTPMIYAMLAQDAEGFRRRIEHFQGFFLHLLVGLSFFASIFAPEVFTLLLPASYSPAIGLVPIIATGIVINGFRKLHSTLIYQHKQPLLVSLGGVTQAVLAFGLNLLWIPTLGASGAAWAKVVSVACASFYFYLLTRRFEPVRLDPAATAVTLGTLGAAALVVLSAQALGIAGAALFALKLAVLGATAWLTWRSRFGSQLRDALSRLR